MFSPGEIDGEIDHDSNVLLMFQQQHLIELIRLRETEAALEFAQTQLAEQGEESRECLTEMERTLALLAFDNPEESPFGDLLNMMQRQKVGWLVSIFCFLHCALSLCTMLDLLTYLSKLACVCVSLCLRVMAFYFGLQPLLE